MIPRAIFVLSILTSLISCNKEDKDSNPNKDIVSEDDYWGCWEEASGNTGVYDIILTENSSEPHKFQFGTNCIPVTSIPAQDIGVFRNDTLILDNGVYEYWCIIVDDTLHYSAYSGVASEELFIKVD